jgi:hypothetical protein
MYQSVSVGGVSGMANTQPPHEFSGIISTTGLELRLETNCITFAFTASDPDSLRIRSGFSPTFLL